MKPVIATLFALLLLFIGEAGMGYAQYTNLHNFTGNPDGRLPVGDLIFEGGYLYGMTQFGGVNDAGTLFKVMPDGTGYEKLLDFLGGPSNGGAPQGSLVSDGTFLYGMTQNGGIYGGGTIFKIMPDGSGYIKLLDFSGVTNGAFPGVELIYDGTWLYGTTELGGTNNMGTLFKIMPDGSGYVKLLDFTGAINGSDLTGSLILDGAFLYGITNNGGLNDMGTIFKIMPDGTGYVKLLDFDGASNGRQPVGSLIFDGTFLYGMAAGGANNLGTIFKIMPDGSGYVKLLDFDGITYGAGPLDNLITDGTYLYGMTGGGGGTIFKIMPDGSGYVRLLNFYGANGAIPYGSLIMDTTFFYGMTRMGGTNNYGTIFKYNECSLPDVVANITDTIVCTGTSIILTGSGASTYSWSDGATDGVAFIPPYTTTYIVVGTDTTGCSNAAYATVNVIDCSGIGDEENLYLYVYPNPTTNYITISIPELATTNTTTYSVLNMLGEKIYAGIITQNNTQMDITNLFDGLYIIEIISYNKRICKKILKTN